MTSLTDFLLARIAEDDASLNECVRLGDPTWFSMNKLMAECDAKRRIVGEWQTFGKVAAEREDQPLPQALTSAGIVVGLERACRALALPYADHADFQEEWRV